MAKGKKKQSGKETSADALSYKGPVIPRDVVENVRTQTIVLNLVTTISSNGSGVINNSFGTTNPSSFPEWTSVAALFDEYRVLAGRLKFIPSNRYNKVVATQTCINPIFSVIDRDVVVTLATTNSAASYESCEMHDLEGPFTRTFRMTGSREAAFINVQSPVNLGSIALFANSLSATLQYGTVFYSLTVQFRGTV